MKRILSCRLRKASMMPLMPSPGIPNTVSTPQANSVSTRTSLAVVFIGSPFECEGCGRIARGLALLNATFEAPFRPPGLGLRREAGAGGVIGEGEAEQQRQPKQARSGKNPGQRRA